MGPAAGGRGKYYFLSRPRRFGKSLLLDTIKDLFEGSEELFRGLAIHDRWDWNVRCPVVRLDFGGGNYKDPDWLKEDVTDQLDHLEESAGVDARSGSGPARLRHLVRALHESAGERVVVLVDEYDKPILDALEAPEVAQANRDYLRGLYSTLKSSDAHIKYLLMALLPDDSQRLARDGSFRELLAARDFAGLEASFRSIFAGIPYQWRVKNDIQEYEGYYASVVYSCFAAQGLDLIAEESSSTGRADMTVRLDDDIYVFEFKPVRKEATGEALAQLKEKGYPDKYRRLGRTVHLIGVEFSREDRNVAAFEVERAG